MGRIKGMKYKVYTENSDRREEKVASCIYRYDADKILDNYGYAFIKFGKKIIFQKGERP